MSTSNEVILRLCETCLPSKDRASDALAVAILAADLPVPVRVMPQNCMNGCSAPVSMALQGAGRATCFFAGIDPVADQEDVINTLRTYIKSPGGWIEDARPCGRLRHCLIGRVPALDDS